MVEFVIIAYNGDVDRLISSIPDNYPIQIYVHSKTDKYDHIAHYNNVFFKPYYQNRGLSKSWNEAMVEGFDRGNESIILVNDDCYFDTFEDVNKIVADTLSHHITAAKNVGYSCIGINKRCYDKVGCFDENIFPAYYEDCDYSRRLALAGIHISTSDCVIHHIGSGTIKGNQALNNQNLHTMMAIQKYYRDKWGGLNGDEIYDYPFNDAQFHPYYISPTTRHLPYLGHNRNDFFIVQL